MAKQKITATVVKRMKTKAAPKKPKLDALGMARQAFDLLMKSKPGQAVLQSKPAQAIDQFNRDIPFYRARFDRGLTNAIIPQSPFDDRPFIGSGQADYDYFSNEADYGDPAGRPRILGSLEESSQSPRYMGGSSEFVYNPASPPSDLSVEERRALLSSLGFRPAAQSYLEQVPVKIGNQYVSENALGTTYKRNGLPEFIGFPSAPNSSPYIPPSVAGHEYLHASPRTTNPDSYSLPEPVQQRISGKWGTNNPRVVQEEAFAEQDYPDNFYKHIFN